MSIERVTITVWRVSDGRHYRSRQYAIFKDALARLKRKPRHEPDGIRDELRGGEHHQTIFYSDEQWAHFTEIARRYQRRFGRRTRK
ncbi:hypothetical protein [Shinella zoogloeoides]|uniref:hypothetical protein n=1 Tax=Shinella zoogloeoides TaxID=352475 RepID=UPI00299E5F0C|nr:hypothetical protein [Shinella zoogloeoides]WPE19936.1 hypothetical protein ShzoTeo12_11140 [Shinella zoogloeoides]